jgi:hypothetical protein
MSAHTTFRDQNPFNEWAVRSTYKNCDAKLRQWMRIYAEPQKLHPFDGHRKNARASGLHPNCETDLTTKEHIALAELIAAHTTNSVPPRVMKWIETSIRERGNLNKHKRAARSRADLPAEKSD